MPTLSVRRRAKDAPRSYRLVLTIDGTNYAVRRVACAPVIADRAFRLLKDDGTLYDVIQSSHGPACDCPDFIFRRDGLDPAGCKHVQALAAYGLIEHDPGPAGSSARTMGRTPDEDYLASAAHRPANPSRPNPTRPGR